MMDGTMLAKSVWRIDATSGEKVIDCARGVVSFIEISLSSNIPPSNLRSM